MVCSFFLVAHSLAVFSSSSVFNQDVSKWKTGAVTNMEWSKCNLSPSVWPSRLAHNSNFIFWILTRFVIYFVFGMLLCSGLFFLSLWHAFLQCLAQQRSSTNLCRHGTCPRSPVWKACFMGPEPSPPTSRHGTCPRSLLWKIHFVKPMSLIPTSRRGTSPKSLP